MMLLEIIERIIELFFGIALHILKFLKYLARKHTFSFWVGSILFIGANFIFLDNPFSIQNKTVGNPTRIEKNLSEVLAIHSGGAKTFSLYDKFLLLINLKKPSYSISLHSRLEKTFPDWNSRIMYQKRQEEFYKSAMKKKQELQKRKLRIRITSNFFTKDELDAMDYFHGTGYYSKYQDPKVQSNIFDTRQSFLLKMHDPIARAKFIRSYKLQQQTFPFTNFQ